MIRMNELEITEVNKYYGVLIEGAIIECGSAEEAETTSLVMGGEIYIQHEFKTDWLPGGSHDGESVAIPS